MIGDKMKNYNKLIELYFRSHNMFKLMENKPRDFGSGDLLYTTEIHTIESIGKNSGINLTKLAEYMGVSKSAVSKTTKKLLKKNYIIKSRPVDNQKEVIFNLTDKGRKAFQGHEIFSQEVFEKIFDILKNLKEDEVVIIESYLKKMNKELAEILKRES